jgi:membrane protease YdiL (CAAX protease family)
MAEWSMLANALLSALMNLIVLAGAPFVAYYAFQKWRGKRTLPEVARRVGLQLGEPRYIGYSLAAAVLGVSALLVWPPPLDPFVREGSAQREFVGLGLGPQAIVMALAYGLIKTGFAEELLFRGLIAGSLSRRLPLIWANVLQAAIFLAPHLLVLFIMPEMWGMLPLVYFGALFAGWLRIKSGSILGPWLLHGSLNVAMCLSVAARTVSA